MTMLLTGTSGMPLPAGNHAAAPPARFVVFQMCWPAATPYPPTDTHAKLELVGSITARETARRWFGSRGWGWGIPAFVTSVMGFAPVVVAKTFPLRVPAILTLSSWGEMAMVTTAPSGPGDSTWLTEVMVVPWFADRQTWSLPK